MRILVRNFKRTERVELKGEGIILLGGQNGHGKSSTLQAVAMAATGNAVPDDRLKGDIATIIHDGQDEATALVDYGETWIRALWPKGEVVAEGKQPPVSRIAAGLDSLCDMSTNELAATLAPIIRADPTRDDLVQALTDEGVTNEETHKAVWGAIEANGWAAALKTSQETGTKLKGRFEDLSGRNYGVKIAEEWRPVGWSDDLGSLKHDDLVAAVDQAKENLEAAVSKAAISGERLAAMKAQAGNLTTLSANIEAAEEDQQKLEDELEAATKAREALPLTQGERVECNCPACGTLLLVKTIAGRTKLEEAKAGEGLTDEQLKDMRLQVAELDGKAARLRTEVRSAIGKTEKARLIHAEAVKAAEALDELGDTAGEDTTAEARDTLQKAETRLKTWELFRDVRATVAKLTNNLKITGLLAPTGLRKTVLARQLAKFTDDHLKPVTKAAGWPDVSIAQDLTISFAGKALRDLGESHRWIVRTVLQVAVARIDGSAFVIIDRADVLDPGNRNKLFGMLAGLKLTALVGMTVGQATNSKALPDLSKMVRGGKPVGATYWLSNGVSQPIAEAVAGA